MKLLSFRRLQTKLFAAWTVALTLFFGGRIVLGHEGDPPADDDPATVVYTPIFTGGGGSGGHSSSRGSGSSYSFGK